MSAGTPKTIDAVAQQIEVLTEVGRRIRECGDIREINRHRNVMDQLRMLARRLHAGDDVVNAAWKEAMQSRRAVGRLLRENGPEHGGDRKSESRSPGETLIDLGLTKSESSRSQSLSFIPDDELMRIYEQVEADGDELILSHFVEIGRRFQEAAGTAAERWAKILQDYCVLIGSIKKIGGMRILAESWDQDRRHQAMDFFEISVRELTNCRDDLRSLIDEGR